MDRHPDDERLSAHHDGALAPAEAAAVEAHLVGCADCRARLEGLRRLDAELTGALAHEPAPGWDEAFASRVTQRVAAESAPRRVHAWWPRSSRAWVLVGAATAAVFVVAGLWAPFTARDELVTLQQAPATEESAPLASAVEPVAPAPPAPPAAPPAVSSPAARRAPAAEGAPPAAAVPAPEAAATLAVTSEVVDATTSGEAAPAQADEVAAPASPSPVADAAPARPAPAASNKEAAPRLARSFGQGFGSPAPRAVGTPAPSSPTQVCGRITDSRGEPLRGVQVMLLGAGPRTRMAKSAPDGSYCVEGPVAGDTLVVMHVGFEPVRTVVRSTAMLRLVLQPIGTLSPRETTPER
ncbi:MAG: zf-HC2 domain-containing protein [bacterium]